MIDSSKLLIVFSNYNGYRQSNNVDKPRISMTIDSFQKSEVCYEDYNVLLLDTGSTDGSHEILKKYAHGNWKYVRKTEEDFYLGTLKKLLDEHSDKYEYILVVDNDQYFFRGGFIETSLIVMEENPEIINIQLNEVAQADIIDKKGNKHKGHIVGVFDKLGIVNNEIWMRSTTYKRQKWWDKKRGTILIPGTKLSRRDCWMWWSASNTFLRSSEVRKVFQLKGMGPPFKNNHDRLTVFARNLHKKGRTAFLARGGSINFGFRLKLSKGFDLRSHLENYHSSESLLLTDGYSFFDDKGKIKPISVGLERINYEKV